VDERSVAGPMGKKSKMAEMVATQQDIINNCVVFFYNLPPHGAYAPGGRTVFFFITRGFADKLKNCRIFPSKTTR
jgi:hypothetical protein